MNHRIGRVMFALVVGLAAAVLSYKWITDPNPRMQRAREEQVVQIARSRLAAKLESDSLEIVDPLAPDRKVGKVYVFAQAPGWAVSGYYRRNEEDRWHPYLILLSKNLELHRLKVQDETLALRAAADPTLEIIQ
ncbi:MAG: hypothetical protein OEM50_11105 [Gammaproteobacteria bacterium]|nr:hypothetical protein [Gammaproteobacteria bacterium]MDH3482256.1 hypothetical protein [Gammaproteobacteria bacterium]